MVWVVLVWFVAAQPVLHGVLLMFSGMQGLGDGGVGMEGGALVFLSQAEDGIRNHCVTGVQTCALPIFMRGQPEVGLAIASDSERHAPSDGQPDLGLATHESSWEKTLPPKQGKKITPFDQGHRAILDPGKRSNCIARRECMLHGFRP